MKKILSMLLIAALFFVSVPTTASAAVKINKKSVTLDVGKTVTLKISGTKSTIKWTSSNVDVATVTSKGKVKAVSGGKTTITATSGKTKCKCVVTVNGSGYTDGDYKVGKDIPSGEYVLFSSSSYGAYYSVSSDSTGSLDSIITNENFNYNAIITVNDGTYLELTRCYAVPFDVAKVDVSGEGTFKVGMHLDPGEYKIVSTSEYGAYIEVFSSSTHDFESIVSNDIFDFSMAQFTLNLIAQIIKSPANFDRGFYNYDNNSRMAVAP